jgi:hypothetical protein
MFLYVSTDLKKSAIKFELQEAPPQSSLHIYELRHIYSRFLKQYYYDLLIYITYRKNYSEFYSGEYD